MINDFETLFLESVYTKPNSYGFIEFNNSKSMKFDYYIFTEGITDKIFYSNINHSLFKKNIKFISMQDKEHAIDKTDVAKTGVMRTFNQIKNELSNDLSKCVFIVDHDYEGVFSSSIVVEDNLKNNFTVTNGYSFENIFLENSNIDKIFNYFGIPDSLDFKNKLNNFIKEINEYNKLKASIVVTYMKGLGYNQRINYRKIYSPEQIFNFDFRGVYPYYFRKDLFEQELQNEIEAVSACESSKRYYDNVSSKFNNNIQYVRGHDIFRFLHFYLWHKHNIDFRAYSKNKNYINIIKILDINMIFKDGNGDLIKNNIES